MRERKSEEGSQEDEILSEEDLEEISHQGDPDTGEKAAGGARIDLAPKSWIVRTSDQDLID